MSTILDFEKPIMEIQEKIEELKKISVESGMDLNKEIETFEQQADDYKKELYSNLKPAQKLQIARHPERPNFLDYVEHICTDFIELHGDRTGMDDRAIIGGLGKIDGKPVMIIGTFVIVPIPAGVFIYLIVSNIVQVIQTLVINKQLDAEAAAKKISASDGSRVIDAEIVDDKGKK